MYYYKFTNDSNNVKTWLMKLDRKYVNESGQFLLFWGVVFLVTTTLIGEH